MHQIWFVQMGNDRYGGVYFGSDSLLPQGGMNQADPVPGRHLYPHARWPAAARAARGVTIITAGVSPEMDAVAF